MVILLDVGLFCTGIGKVFYFYLADLTYSCKSCSSEMIKISSCCTYVLMANYSSYTRGDFIVYLSVVFLSA